MNVFDLKKLVQEIVKDAHALKDKHTTELAAAVNYACIFAQNNDEYNELLDVTSSIGPILKTTGNGLLFHVDIDTVSGKLKILKIRSPDATRHERGDADFTVSNYLDFKTEYLDKKGFKLIVRENMEMLELMDPGFDVRAYFSNPPLDKQFNI